MLAPVLDPFHRAIEPQRGDADEHVLRIKFAADAEAAADMAFVEMDGGRRAAEHARERVAVPVRHLGGAVHFEHVARRVVAGRWRRASPEARRCGGRPPDRVSTTACARGERRVDVAKAFAHARDFGRVAWRRMSPGGASAASSAGNSSTSTVTRSAASSARYGSVANTDGDRLADIAHALPGEDRLAVGLEPFDAREAEIDRRHVGDVRRRPYREDARRLARRVGVDR